MIVFVAIIFDFIVIWMVVNISLFVKPVVVTIFDVMFVAVLLPVKVIGFNAMFLVHFISAI